MNTKPVGAVMVVGGGIAGIQASLDLAESGFYVYLLEKSSGIGGTMAQLDKTFPTNDCSMCILSPKLVECGRHLNIEIMTLSEIMDVSGNAGNFSVRVRKHPGYIDPNKCIACGHCADKCPRKVDDDFNAAMGKRKVAYIKYGQTVPLKYIIDGENCIYLQKARCKACEKFCPTGAINFDDKEQEITVNVGSVILASGFSPFDPTPFDFYGYSETPDLVTSLEYERLLSANGPCMGHLVRPSDNKEPGKIAWIQCVGSRNTHRCRNGYCSSVCCMYAVKQALVTAEHLSGENPEMTIFFIDIRSHGKEFERFYEGAKEKGIRFLRTMPHTILGGKNNIGVSLKYALDSGQQVEEDFDMAVLSVGMEAPRDATAISERLGLKQDKYRFVETSSFTPVSTSREGIYVTGAMSGPKDIPQAVTEASAAAVESARALAAARGTRVKKKDYPEERNIADQQPRIGVFVCSCGINIAGVVDVMAVTEYAKTLPNVVYAENNLFTCSTDTQIGITEKIIAEGLNRVVIAACSPRTHEPLFQDTLKESGLNAYLIEMANIRNQDSWVHQTESEAATLKAEDLVRMAVAKVNLAEPLPEITVNITQRALVIGGGVAGMTAALGVADQGFETVLIEKEAKLGGNALKIKTTWRGEPVQEMLAEMITKVEKHPKITVYTNATLESAAGSVGNFVSKISIEGKHQDVRHGAAILSTGATEYQPTEYLFGEDDRIVTQLKFDEMIEQNAEALKHAGAVAFIQCVGSRDSERPYCSRVCCTHSIKSAIWLKKDNPERQVVIFYRDIRTYGAREDLYTEARKMGVIFIRYAQDHKPDVFVRDGKVFVQALDHILQRPMRFEVNNLVLATAIVARQDNQNLVERYKCGVNADGFFNEAHPKLRPVDMAADGLFVAGLCHYPKPIEETIAQALAAAGRAGVLLSKETLTLSGTICKHNRDICMSCLACFRVCPFGSPYIDEDGKISHDEVKCTGCGICAGVCPAKAFQVQNVRDDQIIAMIDAYTQGL
jgi:heterodisulfide reductase subunit A